jgi:hypothetical protein
MQPRPWLLPTLALLLVLPLALPAFAQLDADAQRAHDRALRDWSQAVGTTGYVYGAPLLESAIAEYRQSAGLGRDLSGPRGTFAHAMGGRRATHETAWLPAPDPDVLASAAWLDLAREPYLLRLPAFDERWYRVRLSDAFGSRAGTLSSRSHGRAGGWYVLATADWPGPLPPGVAGELRSATPVASLVVEIAATSRDEREVHERYQAKLKLLPLTIYRRSPSGAEFAGAQPQPPGPRATEEMRTSLDAFRVINQRLRELSPAPGEAALLALFDRAGFGPGVVFRTGELEAARADGLRLAAREGHRVLTDLRRERTTRLGWHAPSAPPAEPDYLARALRGPAAPSEDLLALECHRDVEGRALDGRRDYRIRFSPPAEQGFWSIAAYGTESERFFKSESGRYSITGAGSAAPGSMEIWISSDVPEDPARRAVWLPVRNEPFFLVARLRDPAPTALDGSWEMAPVEPAE